MAVEYGQYVRLLNAAKADDDPARRQAAHDFLAIIGPCAGATDEDGHCPADSLAAPMLATLYPDLAPAPGDVTGSDTGHSRGPVW